MTLFPLLYSVLVLHTRLLLWIRHKISKKLPPGPRGLPFVGNIHQLGSLPYKRFMEWKEEFKQGMFSLSLGSYSAIVLNTPALIKTAFKMDEFSGRPEFTGNRIKAGISMNEGSSLKEQRDFTARMLRKLGLRNESCIQREIKEVLENLNNSSGKPVSTLNYGFNTAVLNILWKVVSGIRYQHDDPTLKVLKAELNSASTNIRSGAVRYFRCIYQVWKKLSFIGSAKSKEKLDQMNKKFVRSVIEKHQLRQTKDTQSTFIEAYKTKIDKTTCKESSFFQDRGIQNLETTLRDLFLAGVDSTATIMSWEILLLTKYPDYQGMLFEEIKSVIGLSQSPSLKDRDNMPYTKAVIDETLRFSSIAPMGFYHSARKDVSLNGYDIPKGTIVIPNIYGLLHDPIVWSEPESFQPDRFLPGNLTEDQAQAFRPFSVGQRKCMGEQFARDQLFLFTVCLFQRFKTVVDPNNPHLSSECTGTRFRLPSEQNKIVFLDRLEDNEV